MLPSVVAGTIVLAGALIVASFAGGRYAEQQAQKRSGIAADQSVAASSKTRPNRNLFDEADSNNHVLVANVASVSFGELWDVMRAGAPEKRVEWAHDLEQLPPGPRRNGAIKSFYKIWGELDPTAAIEGVDKISDKRMQGMAFAALADAAADSALPAVAELEVRLGRQSSHFNTTSVISRWASADPEAVSRFLEAHPNNDSGHFFNVAYCWAKNDPENTVEWFNKLKLPPLRNSKYPRQQDHRRQEAARGLLLAWLDKDSHGASVYAAAHTEDPNIKEVLGEFGESLFIRSHEEATVFVQSLPNEEVQRAAVKEILGNVGGRSISITEGGDDEEPPEPEINSKEIPAWIVTLPARLWLDDASEIFRAWDEFDSTSADAWLRGLPSKSKSKAIVEYCTSASPEQASRVFELMALVGDAGVREEAFKRYVDNLRNDPRESREKIASLPLTDQQKQTLIRSLSKDQ